MKLLICILWSILICGISFSQDTDDVRYYSLEPYDFHLKYLQNDPAVLIDVRTPMEFRHKRIRDAINLPSSKDLFNYTDSLSKITHIFLYCSTDYRSRRAAELLYEKGFRNLYNLEGGLAAWKKDGMPIENKRSKRK